MALRTAGLNPGALHIGGLRCSRLITMAGHPNRRPSMPRQPVRQHTSPPVRQPTSPPANPPARPPGAADDPATFQLLNEVGIISQLSSRRAEQLLGPGLNLPQFTVLNHLTLRGGAQSLVQIANAIQVSKGAMTNTVARLQTKGLLDVQPDPADGRGKRVSLTPAGDAARRQAVAKLAGGLGPISSLLPPDTLQAALQTLRTLRQWFDANR